MSFSLNHRATSVFATVATPAPEVEEPVPDFQSVGTVSPHRLSTATDPDNTQRSQYCRQNTVVEFSSPEGIVESGGERPKSSADPGTLYTGGMKCEWVLRPEVTAEDVQRDPKLQSLLATQTAVVLDIEYASLETSYESVIFGARLPIVECF